MKPWITLRYTHPADARGWIGLGCFILVLLVLGMIANDKELLANNAFLVLASAIVLTGWNQGPVGWAYQATKSGSELAEKNADIIKERARTDAAPEPPPTPLDASAAASQVAEAATDKADEIKGGNT